MNKGPTLEIHLVPVYRVRNSHGRLESKIWKSGNWATNRYMSEWRYARYRRDRAWPADDEVERELARVMVGISKALADLPEERVKKVVCAAQEDVL